MRTVRVRNRHPSRRLEPARIRRLVRAALAEAPIADHAKGGFELGILITGSSEMARVNQAHLDHAGATDVITFNYSHAGGARAPGAPKAPPETAWLAGRPAVGAHPGSRLEGEILICLDVAGTQAAAYGTTWSLEVLRYLVHGLLHLCGFDDREPKARAVMKRHENRLVKRLQSGLRGLTLEKPVRQ